MPRRNVKGQVKAFVDSPRSPREVLSSLAGRTTWTTPAAGFSTAVHALTPDAAMQMGLSWAGKQGDWSWCAALVATMIATGSPSIEYDYLNWIANRMREQLEQDWRLAKLVEGADGYGRVINVLRDVIVDLSTVGKRRIRRDTGGIRRQNYIRLYHAIYDTLDILAQTAEADAVAYLRG
jgi:hypothetical protein